MHSVFKKPIAVWLSLFLVVLMGGFAFAMLSSPDLNAQVEIARAALERARTAQRIDFSASDITVSPHDAEQLEARKILFIAKMLPLVAAENGRILAQRRTVEHTSSPTQRNALALAYGLKPGHASKNALLKRIDILPPSLVLAQAAIESAWGTSRFAREGNALFGERTFDPDAPGISPKRASGFKVKSFATLQGSVRSYMRTLNTHRAYQALRERRAVLRAKGLALSGWDLAHHLKAYSELGTDYISMITTTIEANRLGDFDTIEAAQN